MDLVVFVTSVSNRLTTASLSFGSSIILLSWILPLSFLEGLDRLALRLFRFDDFVVGVDGVSTEEASESEETSEGAGDCAISRVVVVVVVVAESVEREMDVPMEGGVKGDVVVVVNGSGLVAMGTIDVFNSEFSAFSGLSMNSGADT